MARRAGRCLARAAPATIRWNRTLARALLTSLCTFTHQARPRRAWERSRLMLAYLVIREGSKWADVFRLLPGQAVTVGRAPTNQVVIKDERCSRCHAEIFFSEGQWVLRDLDSRNGTAAANTRIRGDYILEPGDIIRIGQSQLRFVHELAKGFTESTGPQPLPILEDETYNGPLSVDDSSVLSVHEPATITHRRGQTKFLEPHEPDETSLP